MCLNSLLSPTIELVTREDWGALPPKKSNPIRHPVPYIYLNISTDTPSCKNQEECTKLLQEMQKNHMEKGMSDIQYNFLLGEDGKVYEGRGWLEKPHRLKHFPSLHGQIMEVACIGDYSEKLRPLPMYQIQWDLLAWGMQEKYLTKECAYW